MTTLISQIRNEEFLLPFFIDHHYERFENGIILDFGSTDRSISILKEMAPNWIIVDCSDQVFGAAKVDSLVHSIEENIQGVCLALTVTEFFIGDSRFISEGMVVPSYSLLRTSNDPEIKQGQRFHEIYRFGVSPFQTNISGETEWLLRLKGRKVKSSKERYPIGRHYEVLGVSPFLIYRVANCLASKEMIKRRLQIQDFISQSDIKLGFGNQHTNHGRGLNFETLNQTIEIELLMSEDVSPEIFNALKLEATLRNIKTDSDIFEAIKDLTSLIELNQTRIYDLLEKNSDLNLKLTSSYYDLAKSTKEGQELAVSHDSRVIKDKTISHLEDLVREKQREVIEIVSLRECEIKELRKSINILEIQSSRPSHNFKKLLITFLPALKVRITRLFK